MGRDGPAAQRVGREGAGAGYAEDGNFVEAVTCSSFSLRHLPPTPGQYKPKPPVSSIKVRKRKKRRGVRWGETSTRAARVVTTSYTRFFGD